MDRGLWWATVQGIAYSGLENSMDCSPWGHKKLDTTERLSLNASLVAQLVKNLPAMWETWVRSLGEEDTLENGMAAHSSIPAWEILWTEEPGGLWSTGW